MPSFCGSEKKDGETGGGHETDGSDSLLGSLSRQVSGHPIRDLI